MTVRAGELRHQVRIEQRTIVRDAVGEPLDAWNLVVIRRASMKKSVGAEVWSADMRSARVPVVFRLRFVNAAVILPEMRLICKGRLYDIVSVVDPDGTNDELVITAMEHPEEAVS